MNSMRIDRIFDADQIKNTIAHPKIYDWVSDDSCPKAEYFFPLVNDQIIYLGCFLNEEYVGLFMIVPQAMVWHDFHTCLLPNAWGLSVDFVKLAVDWMFKNTECRRLTTIVPENNKLALKLAKKSGAIEYGFNPGSWLKNGILSGVHMLGISKESEGKLCQQQSL